MQICNGNGAFVNYRTREARSWIFVRFSALEVVSNTLDECWLKGKRFKCGGLIKQNKEIDLEKTNKGKKM